jgi:hypothetical protein
MKRKLAHVYLNNGDVLNLTRIAESGHTFDPHVIADSLSKQCRFNGHTREFYSVAQHSLRVLDLLVRWHAPHKHQLAGLLHDASEAYVGDLIMPLRPYALDFNHLEHTIQQWVFSQHGISGLPEIVKKADCAAAWLERRDLLNWSGETDTADDIWFPTDVFEAYIKPELDFLHGYRGIRLMTMDDAKASFIGAYMTLIAR